MNACINLCIGYDFVVAFDKVSNLHFFSLWPCITSFKPSRLTAKAIITKANNDFIYPLILYRRLVNGPVVCPEGA